MRHALAALLATLLLAIAANAQQGTQPQPPSKTAAVPQSYQAALQDIESTLGMVPSFLRAFPESALPGAWAAMKGVQLNPQSAIPAKNKELIGLAVAAQIPCVYCTYFHTQVAKLNGASEDEIKRTLAEASLTRYMSTYLNGSRLDMTQFRAEVDRAALKVQRQATAGATELGAKGAPITDAASARRDIEQAFGFVPAFLSNVPEEVLPGLWSEWKAVEMTPGPIPAKYLTLTSLAVASQVPCEYCVYADTSFAEAQGASKREIQEAVLVAATVRHWSTYLNGTQADETKFRKEVDQMVAGLKKKQKPATR